MGADGSGTRRCSSPSATAMHALVAHDHGRKKDFRIKKVSIPARA
jgi:hypothetical protein